MHSVTDTLIDEILAMLQTALGPELKGLYLFGSLIGGDFDINKSDIDLLVMVGNVISESQLARLKTAHEQFTKAHPEWDDRIEIAYVSVDGMKNFKTETNTIARISPGEALHFRDMDINWLMDWHMVLHQGKTIFGPPPETYIPPISDGEYVHSIRTILAEHAASAVLAQQKGYQSYIVMSFCRNLYAIKHGRQVSKIAGARWAADNYPQWAEFINQAVSWRGMTDNSASPETQQQTIKFAEFASNESRSFTE